MALTTFLVRYGHNPWYLLPIAVAITQTWSVRRVVRKAARPRT